MTFPWVGAERALTIAEAALALAERDVSPSRTARLTGAQERLARALDRAHRRGRGPRRRPGSATPTGGSRSSRSRAPTARAPSPGSSPTSCCSPGGTSGRRPRTASSSTSGWSSRATGPGPAARSQILAAQRHRRRRPRDRPRRDRPARRRLRVERGERPDQRLVRPPRPAGHPHAARAGRGQVDDLPDHQARRLGRAQRRRSARRGGRPPGPRPRRPLHARGRRARPSSRRHRARGGRAYLVRDGRIVEAERRDARRPIVEVAPGPDHDRRPGPPQRRQRARGRRRRARPRRDHRRRCATGSRLSRRPPSARPAGSTCSGSGPGSSIVDFAHNEAGVSAVLDVAEGIAGGRRRPGRADHGDHRDRRRPARRHAARASAGSPPSGPSGSRSSRRSATCAAGPRESVVGELLVGVVAGGGRPGRRPDLRLRDGRAPGRAQRGGRAATRRPGGRGAGHRADVPRGARRRLRAARRASARGRSTSPPS